MKPTVGWRIAALAALSVLGTLKSSPARAQDARNRQIAAADSAYAAFNPGLARDLLIPALNPASGPRDSVWAKGVQLLSQILLENGDSALAAVWLRWAFRSYPALEIDSLTFLPDVVTAALAARNAVQRPSVADSVTTTSWVWPTGAAPRGSAGTLRIAPTGLGSAIRIVVEGTGRQARDGQSLNLAPGTYGIQAAADGYLAVRVSREVLDGVTTVLDFHLRPVPVVAIPDSVLPDAVAAATMRRVVKLTVERFGVPSTCGAGFLVGRSGLVITSYRTIRGASRVSVVLPGNRTVTEGVLVAARDAGQDLALLRVPAEVTDTLAFAQTADSLTAWAVGFPGCAEPQFSRVRARTGPDAGLRLTGIVVAGQFGGPVINQAGSVIGLVLTGDSAAPASRLPALLAEGRLTLQRNQMVSLEQVGLAEKHLYGSLLIRSATPGAVARIRAIEPWHWPRLPEERSLPFEFAGPLGRYAVELLVGGQMQREATVSILPGVRTDVALEPVVAAPAVAAAPPKPVPTVAARSRGISPVPFILIGVVGAGVGVCFVANVPPCGDSADKGGTISVSIVEP